MKNEQCPMCGTGLIVRDVTPCIECGAKEDQVAILLQNIETSFQHDSVEYYVYRIFGTLEISLCDFCALDIGSYDPDTFGLEKNDRLGYHKLELIKTLHEPSIGKDKYCPECQQRLSFTNFVLAARELNSS